MALDGINSPAGSWYTQELPDKGIGMLAKHDLKRGDLITAYTPVLLVHREKALSVQEREKFLRIAVDQLPVATKKLYFSLTTAFGDPTVIVQDVIQANSFEMQVGGQMHLAIFPETSRLNHDCAPKYGYLFPVKYDC
jgi:ribosomal RNA assembly protein